MTAPRQVLSGTTYLVSRRCAQRQFLLKPSETTNRIFLYVLAVAAERYGVLVHGLCVLSNHFHILVTDPEARLPAFMQYLHALVARSMNGHHGRWESFWAPASYSAVTLLTPDDVIEKTAYTLANPVAAGLVHRGRDWPGLWTAPEQIDGGVLEVSRPTGFFRAKGKMPETARLQLTRPPDFDSSTDYLSRLGDALADREAKAHAELQANEQRFLGPKQVQKQSPTDRPRSVAPRRGLRPRVAGHDKWKRIEALQRLATFLQGYREAWKAFSQGVRDVVFPAGTYWLRVAQGVRCEAPS